MRLEHDGYSIDDDPARVDVGIVTRFLTDHAYWGRWRTPADLRKQIAEAWRVVGVYAADGTQVGFARATSDEVSEAYLGDVFVVPEHRGRGLSKRLVELMIDRGSGAHLRWTLFTSDAHGLYSQFGFREPGPTAMVRLGTFASRPLEDESLE